MIIALMGPPGSGKGTIAQMLKKKGWIHYSMGQALREHVENHGKYAKIVGKLNAKGILSPNRIVTPIFNEFFLKNRTKKIVLDGYPRNLGQARGFGKVLRKVGTPLDAVIVLKVPIPELIKRLSGRRQCVTCEKIYGVGVKTKKKNVCDSDGGKLFQRDDDKPVVVKHRFGVYKKETQLVIEWASSRYPVYLVNGRGGPSKVFKRVSQLISLIQQGS